MRARTVAPLLLLGPVALACSAGAPDAERGGGEPGGEGAGGAVQEWPTSGDSAARGTRGALPGLFGIMAGLQNDMVRIGRGLWLESFDTIAAGARSVADHPTIPAGEAESIASVLGPDMGRFQEMDTRVHDDAVRLFEAAGREDLDAVLGAEADLRRGCVECHRAFRERLRAGIR